MIRTMLSAGIGYTTIDPAITHDRAIARGRLTDMQGRLLV